MRTERKHTFNAIDELALPQVWGGVECTCNRVGDAYFDQMDCSGHHQRISDFEKFAELGITSLRMGFLWEHENCDTDLRWRDAALAQLQALRIRPIAGLLHHGSGPSYTSLLDPEFPTRLAAYAERAARRHPSIDAYTPVNEPNTTARFSGMYGIWYPHHLSRKSYLRAVLNELKGTVLSMRAIRRIRPDAQLIQTEDVGTISGTDELRPVWELLDLRRWLTFDLLCGVVDRCHPIYAYMRSEEIPTRDILWFADHPCAPDVIGINYYATSDRFIDHRIKLYSDDRRSAEGPFVDVEAVRVKGAAVAGFDSLLGEAWRRYQIPVAVTEVHLGGHIDEQIRWAAYAWRGIKKAQREGAFCAAMTFWSLLGSFYWNQLVTCRNGHYEPGVFDIRSGTPVATELAGVVRQIAAGGVPRHPALSHEGWWLQPERVCFPVPQLAAA